MSYNSKQRTVQCLSASYRDLTVDEIVLSGSIPKYRVVYDDRSLRHRRFVNLLVLGSAPVLTVRRLTTIKGITLVIWSVRRVSFSFQSYVLKSRCFVSVGGSPCDWSLATVLVSKPRDKIY